MANEDVENTKQINKKKVILFALILLLLIFLVSRLFSKSVKIALEGSDTMDVEYGTTFSDPSVKATYGKKDISDTVEVSGNVDTSKVGTYTLTYTAKHKKKTQSVTRTINVTDSVPPEIKLNGDEEINIAQGSKYQELGCIATDKYDGDITTKISIENPVKTSEKGSYTVKYTVKDSSGNTATAQRKVNVVESGSKNISTAKAAGLPVLMYHFFYDKTTGDTGKDGNCMEIHDFEDQLKYLTENKYYFPTWEEVENYVKGTSCLPEHSVVITVDDGNETFFDLAVPVINKYDVKVTSFVVTSWIENKEYLNKFDRNKIIFQSHSNDMHKSGSNGKGTFLTMSEEDALADLKASKEFIGNATVFCYPFGDQNENCQKTLEKAGYNMAFTTAYGRVRPGDNPYALSRIRMTKGDSLTSFTKRVS
ncbi:MAG: DUF5011 domain-containing protein [Clostridia bacterium]|nr:DUF5011 domain-containing protein [Clostridia bacterium]